MGIATDIEWCDSTLNLQMGCDGCELWNPKLKIKKCYAGNVTERWGGKRGWPDSFEEPKLFLERLEPALAWPDLTGKERPHKPWLDGLPRLIFVNDMGDTFTESLPLDWLAPLLPKMALSPHIYIVLTKRANRMEEFSKLHPFPDNFWLMTSVTCQANENRIRHLMRSKGGSVRGISFEPATEIVDFSEFLSCHCDGSGKHCFSCLYGTLDWIIVGGESGQSASTFDLDRARDVIRQTKAGEAFCFVKQVGSRPGYQRKQGWVDITLSDPKGGDWDEWPTDVRLREFPRHVPLRHVTEARA